MIMVLNLRIWLPLPAIYANVQLIGLCLGAFVALVHSVLDFEELTSLVNQIKMYLEKHIELCCIFNGLCSTFDKLIMLNLFPE